MTAARAVDERAARLHIPSTVMDVLDPEDITMREARRHYFEANGFGTNGNYDDAWVDFKLGPLPFPFPNTAGRIRAVRYHDLHHVLTGYATDIVGEFEISAWEIAAGCKGFAAAWILNLGGIAGGVVRAPRRTFAAFARGRRHRTLYGEDLDALLDEKLDAVRARFAPEAAAAPARLRDGALFALAACVGLIVGLVMFAFMTPLVPIGLVAGVLRPRSS